MRKFAFYAGIAGIIASFIFQGVVKSITPGFNSIADPASNLAAMQYGWLQNASFLAGGIAFFCFGISLYYGWRQYTKVTPVIVSIWGIILALEVLFPSNPTQTNFITRIHIMLFMLGIVALVVAIAIAAIVLRNISAVMSVYSALTVIVALAGFVGLIVTKGATGLMQDLTAGPLFTWIVIASIYGFFQSKHLDSNMTAA